MKLLAEMRLEDEYNYNILLRMTSENFEEIFQLIKDDITKENTKMGELIPSTSPFLSTEELCKSYVYQYYSSYSTMNSSTFTSFRAFVFSISSSLSLLWFFHKNFLQKKQITWFKLHSFN